MNTRNRPDARALEIEHCAGRLDLSSTRDVAEVGRWDGGNGVPRRSRRQAFGEVAVWRHQRRCSDPGLRRSVGRRGAGDPAEAAFARRPFLQLGAGRGRRRRVRGAVAAGSGWPCSRWRTNRAVRTSGRFSTVPAGRRCSRRSGRGTRTRSGGAGTARITATKRASSGSCSCSSTASRLPAEHTHAVIGGY